MTHLQRFAFATILSVCLLVGVGVCDAEVRRAPTVEVDAVSGATPVLGLASVPAGASADAGLAVPPVPPAVNPDDPAKTAGQLIDALKAGKFVTAAALAVILLVFGLRAIGPAWFKTDRGGAVLAVTTGVALAFIGFEALGALTGRNVILTLIAGLLIAGSGVGWRNLVSRLFFPPDKAAPEVDL